MEEEGALAPSTVARVVSVLVVLLAAVVLAVLPALVAVGAIRELGPTVAAGVGGLVVVVGGVKLVAMAWGLRSRPGARSQRRPAAVIAIDA